MFETLDAIPRQWAQRTPDGIALVDGARRMRWRELADSVDACAAMLARNGVGAGDRVAIVAENSIELVVLLFAVSAQGGCAVIVNPRLSDREVDAIVGHAQLRCIAFVPGTAAEANAHSLRYRAVPVPIDGLHAISIAEAADDRIDVASPSGLATIVYTSGTSGRPKGVMLSHANLRFVAETSARLRRIDTSDRVLGALPIYHVYGLASMLLGSLSAGASLMLFARFDAAVTLEAIEAGGLTIVQGVPAMYARMLSHLGVERRIRVPVLRYLYAGGSPLDPSLKARVEERFGTVLHNGYGLTECSPTVAQTRLDAPRSDTSVGPPIPGVDVRIVDASQDDVERGAVGELWIRGPNVMQGYFRDADATARAITPDGWLRSGDLAREDDDGALFIVGRAKELIIRSGLNIYPGEVEAVLASHADVSQCVVVGRAIADGEEEVVAFVELHAGRSVSADALHAHAAANLAPYKRPSEICLMATLPASATGKVLRSELKRLAQCAARSADER